MFYNNDSKKTEEENDVARRKLQLELQEKYTYKLTKKLNEKLC